MSGGGPLIHRSVDLAWLPARKAAFVTAVHGLQTVEIVTLEPGPAITALSAPDQGGCKRFPVALASHDVNADGLDDVLILDPACGNWIALGQQGGGFGPAAWEDVLPALPPNPYLYAIPIPGEERPAIVSSNEGAIAVARFRGAWERIDLSFLMPYMSSLHASDILAATAPLDAGGIEVAFQRGEFLTMLALTPASAAAAASSIEARIDVPQELIGALKPHIGYDHLTSFVPDGCELFALGVGLYPPEAGDAPRRVHALRRAGGSFVAEQLPLSCDVTTFAVVHGGDGLEPVLGAVERCGDDGVFELARIVGCGERVEVLSQAKIEFNWRGAPAPPSYSRPTLPRTSGVRLIADRPAPTRVRFVHYDGFDLRVFTAEDGDGWTIRSTKTSMHNDREDVSW
ncbi:hypothetical protein [Sorangium sp. So ce128]|uniref:hypothetical protein n=1 Tax=Sorangium sp. So ce128 TaxID=3133281 RepID=UPI003F62745B